MRANGQNAVVSRLSKLPKGREGLALIFFLVWERDLTTGGPPSFHPQDFRIEFHFSENEYFTNPVLTKLYKVSITYFQPLAVY